MKKILVLVLIAAILGAAVWWFSRDDRYAAAPLTTADFAIEDTSAIAKVVITDAEGERVAIERGNDNIWMLDTGHRARLDAINLILKTLHLIEIKHPVPKSAQETIFRMLAGRHKYVQVYDRNGDLMNAYYVGMMTSDERGTYMLLEQPEKGRTDIPYVMTMKSFYGYLSSRFFTDELDWRDRVIFRYHDLDFNRVEVTNHLFPDRSFAIEYKGGNDLSFFEMPGNTPVPVFDTARVQEYLLLYKKAGAETFDLAFEQYQIDSILALDPDFEIKVIANDPEESRHLRFFQRPAGPDQLNEDGTPAEYDNAIMYATLDGKELFRVQRFVFRHFLPPKQAFTGELDF